MSETHYKDEMYKKNAIRVSAERYDASSAWTIKVNIRDPNGSQLPTVHDRDLSYPTLEDAFAAGFEHGRKRVDS